MLSLFLFKYLFTKEDEEDEEEENKEYIEETNTDTVMFALTKLIATDTVAKVALPISYFLDITATSFTCSMAFVVYISYSLTWVC